MDAVAELGATDAQPSEAEGQSMDCYGATNAPTHQGASPPLCELRCRTPP
jgi:hypothetical protein